MNTQAKKTILVADDESSIRALVKRYLSNYVVLEAEDGVKAMEIART